MATLEERIAAQEKRLKDLKQKKQEVEAAKKLAEAKRSRAAETRRKILAGALVLEMMGESEETKNRFMARLDKFLTRSDDRALFSLPEQQQKGDGHAVQ